MTKYDIFISYRRSSYDTANLIATRLKAAGYSVFFDMETLRAGKFNEQLFNVIDNCKDFIVVLPPRALDRCVNEDDWVRQEVCRAMAAGKNIIPVMLNGFTWPAPMPEGMDELQKYHALTASTVEYFDMAMERLQKKYLTSKRIPPVKRILQTSLIVLASLAVLLLMLWTTFRVLSKDVCLKYASALVSDASYVHIIAEENQGLRKEWDDFIKKIQVEYRTDRLDILKTDMLGRIDLAESNLKQIWRVDSAELNISNYHSFLLSLNGANAENIALSPVFATLYYTDYLGQLQNMRDAVLSGDEMNRRFIDALFEVFDHSINGYYATVLSELAPFPKTALIPLDQVSSQWKLFPHSYVKGEDMEYYQNLVEIETAKADEALSRFKSVLEQQDAELEDIQRNNDVMEGRIAAIDQNKENLEIRRMKVSAKEQILESTKAELEVLEKQMVQTYETLKQKCTLEESDDQWYQWGKIRRWGVFMNTVAESREALKADGIHSTSSITPEVAFADLSSQLRVYETYHPESAPYVAAARQFFKEVSKCERPYAGVLIFAFKDDAVHPFFKVGDIVIACNGKNVKSYDGFKAIYKDNKDAVVTYLRLEDGHFNQYESKITETGITGFLDLTE